MKIVYMGLSLLFLMGTCCYSQHNTLTNVNFASNFCVTLPLHLLCQKYDFVLRFIKEDSTESSGALVQPKDSNDPHFPESLYNTVIENLDILPWSPTQNYSDAYDAFKKDNFIANDWVSYQKPMESYDNNKMINICDINHDNLPEIIVQDLQNSSKGNPIYQLYKWDSLAMKCILVPEFFNHAAFYGCDKTSMYIITGSHDKGERHLVKNKVTGYKLIPIDSTDISDADIFDKW